MKRCLIILTNYFPFHKGEEYLESEIPIIAKKFDKVFVLASMIGDNQVQTRKVPENVIIIPGGIEHGMNDRIKMIIEGTKTQNLEKDNKNIIKLIYSKYFESRSKMISKNFLSRLSNYEFESYEEVTIYSYWLYISARIGIEIKNKMFKNLDNVKLISRAHGYDLYEDRTMIKFLPEREFLLSNMDYVFPVSDHGTQLLKSKYPQFNGKISTKRLGTFSNGIISERSLTPLHLVSVSTARPLKRINLIIEAVSILQKKGINVIWSHFGDGKEIAKLKKLAQEKLERNSFNFYGHINNQNLMEWYDQTPVDIFVNVSTAEGLPVSIMEAISKGLPIIATDVGGTNEIVFNDYNGILLDKDLDSQTLSNAINHMYNLPIDKFNEYSCNSYLLWDKEFNAIRNYNIFSNQLLFSDK